MWHFLAKLDPNAVLAVVTALGAYAYHRIKPASRPRYFSQDALLKFARETIAVGHALMPEATAKLKAYAISKVRVELARVGQILSPAWEDALHRELNKLVDEYERAQ